MRRVKSSRVKHATKYAAPTREQIDAYNLTASLRGRVEGDYQTGPRRGQQWGEFRAADEFLGKVFARTDRHELLKQLRVTGEAQ